MSPERNMRTRQMIPFFTLFLTFISEFENTQNSFRYGPPFCLFWPVKYIFGQKLLIWAAFLIYGRKRWFGYSNMMTNPNKNNPKQKNFPKKPSKNQNKKKQKKK